MKLPKREWLIDRLLRAGDSVLLVGDSKSGKSLLVNQLICSLVSGHPFLDQFEVLKPSSVTLVMTEGELSDTQDRYKRMIKALDFDEDKFQLVFSGPLALEKEDACMKLMQTIDSVHSPKILIFDSLYQCFNGSLSDDKIVRKLLGNMRKIKDVFGCVIIIVHHTHRVRFNQNGDLINEGDDAVFGSSALKWWPDHMFFFTHNKKRNIREFRCSTQRSGDILDKIELYLEQPYPLYFRTTTAGDTANGLKIIKLLQDNGPMAAKQVYEALGISKASFYRDLKPCLKDNQVFKNDSSRPVLYGLE